MRIRSWPNDIFAEDILHVHTFMHVFYIIFYQHCFVNIITINDNVYIFYT